jgi:hypothetical protein
MKMHKFDLTYYFKIIFKLFYINLMSAFTNSHIYANENIYKIVLSMEDVSKIASPKKNEEKKSKK